MGFLKIRTVNLLSVPRETPMENSGILGLPNNGIPMPLLPKIFGKKYNWKSMTTRFIWYSMERKCFVLRSLFLLSAFQHKVETVQQVGIHQKILLLERAPAHTGRGFRRLRSLADKHPGV